MQKNITKITKQQGLGTIFVLMILVALAGLAAGIVWISRQQQAVIADDVREAKVQQLALAAVEWGKAKALKEKPFNDDSGNLKICDPSGDTSMSATLKVKTSTYTTANNVERYISKISVVACSSACGTACENTNANSNYREKYLETLIDFCEIDSATKECKVKTTS